MIGRIFSVQRFSLDDGCGIRTLVFLKGCPLKCAWCSNPESQDFQKQVLYYMQKCKGCGKCIEICPVKCIVPSKKYGLVTDHKHCVGCMKCVDACFYGAREMKGEDIESKELLELILKDKGFYDNSDGGVTFSGGEVFIQSEFFSEILKSCRVKGIHTAVETSLQAKWEDIEKALPYIDLIFCDYKHWDSKMHKQFTGSGNELIWSNLKKIAALDKEIIVRIPCIPGFNNDVLTIRCMLEKLENIGIKKVELLPFHRIGSDKYKGLGRTYKYGEQKSIKRSELLVYESLAEDLKLTLKIGGRKER